MKRTRQRVEGEKKAATNVTRRRERFIGNMYNLSGSGDGLDLQQLTRMTWSVCVQPGEVFSTECLHLIPLFRADERRDIKHDKSKQTSADMYMNDARQTFQFQMPPLM